jgi:DNA-binding CsgD family transcriptional regulator
VTENPVQEIAELLNVSLNTLKSQLASVYLKTNTARQSQLIRLITRLSMEPSG